MVPPILIQPFNLVLQRYNYYFSIHPEDHPECDSIQVLVKELPGDPAPDPGGL